MAEKPIPTGIHESFSPMPPSLIPRRASESENATKSEASIRTVRPEGGHSLRRIRPITKHTGSSVIVFFNGFFTTIIGISTLGTSITFAYILNDNNVPPTDNRPYFDSSLVQLLLAISWLLFLLALAFASLGSSLLTFFKEHWKEDWDGLRGEKSQFSVQMYAVCTTALIGTLTIAAFAILCLVVVAYTSIVGWIALGFTTFFGFIVLMAIWNNAPWPWRDNTPSERHAHLVPA